MVQTRNIEFQYISESLAKPDRHEELFPTSEHDSRALGVMLAALSQQMLPYWEARYSHDEKMERLVRKLEQELEKAIGDFVVRRLGLKSLPLLPSQQTMHLMAKAAVAVCEFAEENQDQVE